MSYKSLTPYITSVSPVTLSVSEGNLPPLQDGNAMAYFLSAGVNSIYQLSIPLIIKDGLVCFSIQGSQPVYVSFLDDDLINFPNYAGSSSQTQGQWCYPNTSPTKCGFSLQAGNYALSSPPIIYASIDGGDSGSSNVLNVYQFPATKNTLVIESGNQTFVMSNGSVAVDSENNVFTN